MRASLRLLSSCDSIGFGKERIGKGNELGCEKGRKYKYQCAMEEECVVLNAGDPLGEPFLLVFEALCNHFSSNDPAELMSEIASPQAYKPGIESPEKMVDA